MSLKSFWRWERTALCFLWFTLTLVFPGVGSSQEEEAEKLVRVPKSHANVHLGPTTARPVLVLAPKDTVLRVVGRRGEWLEVELAPELRDTGIVVRWYENEETGWMHESTVEQVEDN